MPLPNLGQPPALSSVHLGLYQRPHWGGSGHRLLACPQGSGPLTPAPVLTFPARQAHPSRPEPLPQLLQPAWPVPSPSPKPFHPAPLLEETHHKDPSWIRREYRTDLRFGVMAAQSGTSRQNCPGQLVPCTGQEGSSPPLGSLHLAFPAMSHLAGVMSSQDPLPV